MQVGGRKGKNGGEAAVRVGEREEKRWPGSSNAAAASAKVVPEVSEV